MRTASWEVPQGATHQTRYLRISDDRDDVMALSLQGFLDDPHLGPEERAALVAPDGKGYSCPATGIRRVSRQDLEEYFDGEVPEDFDPDNKDVWLLWISRSDLGAGRGLSDAVIDGDELRHLLSEAILTRPTGPTG